MQHIISKYLIIYIALMALAVPEPSRGLGQESDDHRTARCDLSEGEAATVLDWIFRGRRNRALAYLDSLEIRSEGEPLFLIMRARCFQEFIPMDDVYKAGSRRLSYASLDDLDRCIDVCTRRIDSGDPEARLYLLRGWAWMAKAYVRSMTKDLHSAGRDAKRGKKDLERYLSTHPDDPTAVGMLGAFLYFADTIPGAFKLISKILLLPSGDRENGLEYLERAVSGGGLLETDWKLILYNVYFYFEGRFEEALSGLESLLETYPEYGRTAIPLAVSRLYDPHRTVATDELVETAINRMYSAPPLEVDWNALYLVQLFRALGDRYFNHTSTTMARLNSIVHESPRHPDWALAVAHLELGRLYASRGDREQAVTMFETVAERFPFEQLRKTAEKLLQDVEKFGGSFAGPRPPELDSWVSALYRSRPDSLGVLRSRFSELASKSLAAQFYAAECDLRAGDFDRALEIFNDVISVERPAWEHRYQMIASARIAEIYASRGYYKTAARYQDIALSYHRNEYLIDWVMEGRKRHFERLADGKEAGPPTLLSASRQSRRDTLSGGPGGGPDRQGD